MSDLRSDEQKRRDRYGMRPMYQKKACNGRFQYDYFVNKDNNKMYRRLSIIQDESMPVWRRYLIEQCDDVLSVEEFVWKAVEVDNKRGYDYKMHREWRKIPSAQDFEYELFKKRLAAQQEDCPPEFEEVLKKNIKDILA